MRYPIIISGFPLVGKTYLSKIKDNPDSKKFFPFNAFDLESSDFSWIMDEDCNKVRNPAFPDNYAEYLENTFIKGYECNNIDIVLTSSHGKVQQALVDKGIKFIMAYPENNEAIKQAWLDRFDHREYNGFTREFLESNFEKFIEEGEAFSKKYNIPMFYLRGNETLYDKIADIVFLWMDFYM